MPDETIPMAWLDNVTCGMDIIGSLIFVSIFQNDIM